MKVFDIKCEIMALTSSILPKNKPSQIKVVIIEEKISEIMVKFIYSEKATKFCEISTLHNYYIPYFLK